MDWLLPLVCGVMVGLMLGCGIGASWGGGQGRQKAQWEYYKGRYQSSVETMLEEAVVDREKLRALRDSGEPDAIIKATRFLQTYEPVPLRAAAEFVRRI
ncbi:MAG: hypothetical protein LBK28_07745 [Propionibacteriaceae bacterium]|jgi:hypothetical protein|nr:hypothetical protein [Propionibacteriaceae bacterium]